MTMTDPLVGTFLSRAMIDGNKHRPINNKS